MRSLNLLVLRCADIEKSRLFYERFGLSFAKHQHGKGPEHYAHEDAAGVLELYPGAPGKNKNGLGFEVADLQAKHAELKDYSPGEIADNQWGRSFVIKDPDGCRIEVKQAANAPEKIFLTFLCIGEKKLWSGAFKTWQSASDSFEMCAKIKGYKVSFYGDTEKKYSIVFRQDTNTVVGSINEAPLKDCPALIRMTETECDLGYEEKT